jgi:16S rRNA (guanine527-N7)-methyltransferase
MNLQDSQREKIERYLDLLIAANARMNLTRIVDRQQAENLHVADALTLLPFLPAGEHRLADVGSGGGVPGLILAIARPDARVTLIEATKKKAEFLKTTAAELELPNVEIAAVRAEEAGRSNLRESFDVVVARAVGTLDWLAEWTLPLAKKGGMVLAMKGAKAMNWPRQSESSAELAAETPKFIP